MHIPVKETEHTKKGKNGNKNYKKIKSSFRVVERWEYGDNGASDEAG